MSMYISIQNERVIIQKNEIKTTAKKCSGARYFMYKQGTIKDAYAYDEDKIYYGNYTYSEKIARIKTCNIYKIFYR